MSPNPASVSRHCHQADSVGEACLHTLHENLKTYSLTGNTEKLHDTLAALNPAWSWSKARRYARRLINQTGERRARALEYATNPAGPRDRFEGRHSEGTLPRDLTGNRAAHNLDVINGGARDA